MSSRTVLRGALGLVTFVALVAGCSSASEPSTNASSAIETDAGVGDAGAAKPFEYTLGTQGTVIGSPVTIRAQMKSGVYEGYFEASSDFSKYPSVSVRIHAPGGALAAGDYPCAHPTTTNVFDDTSALISVGPSDINGANAYWTNIYSDRAPACNVHVSDVTSTSVTILVTGTTYFESGDLAPTSLRLSFTANVLPTP